MILELPSELIKAQDYSMSDLKADVAVMLYQGRRASLARLASWLEMTRLEFQKVLADRGIPINMTIEDFKTDLESLKSMPS